MAVLDKNAFAGFRPTLLLLAPFLATLDIFVANLRVVRDVSGAPDNFGSIAPAMMVACLAACLVFICVPGIRSIVCDPTKPRLVAVGAVYSLSQIAFWILALTTPAFASVAVWVLGALMGFCVIPLFVAWQACFGINFRSILLHGAVVCLITVIISVVVLQFEALPAAVVWCVCSALGAFAPAYLKVQAVEPAQCEGQERVFGSLRQAMSLFSGLWLPLLGLCVCMLCSCMSETSRDGQPVHGEFYALVIGAVVAWTLCCLRLKTPLAVVVDKLAAPTLVALAIVMGGSFSAQEGSVFGAISSFAPVMFMSLYALASLTAIQGPRRTLVASIVLAGCCLSMLLGSALAVLAGERTSNGPLVRAVTFAYYALILVDLGCVAWKLLVEKDEAATDQSASEDADSRKHVRVESLARERGLTKREAEVLEQLAAGHNSRFIASALLISDNTVRTHMRSIYRKLGVSTQSELVVLVASGGGDAGQG